jgi:hypothetical protein
MARVSSEREVKIVIVADDKTKPVVDQVKAAFQQLDAEHKRSTEGMSRNWESAKKNWLVATAAITASVVAVRKAWDMAQMAAAFEEQQTALGFLSARWGVTAASITRSVQEAASGVINLRDASQLASTALSQGFNPEQIAKLTALSEQLSDVTGRGLTEIFEALQRSVTTGREAALAQFGIMVDFRDAVNDYGEKATKLGEIQSRVNDLVKAGDGYMAQFGQSVDSTADKMDRLNVQWEDAKLKAGNFFIKASLTAIALAKVGTNAMNARGPLEDLKAIWSVGPEVFGPDISLMSRPPSPDEIREKIRAQFRLQNEIAMQEMQRFQPISPMMELQGGMADPFADLALEYETRLSMHSGFLAEKVRFEQEANDRLAEYRLQQQEGDRLMYEMRMGIAANFAGSMAGLFQSLADAGDKTRGAAFAAYKAFAIAEAIIDAHKAYTAALAGSPPPWNYFAAAAVFASAIARVRAITAVAPRSAAPSSPGAPGMTPAKSTEPPAPTGPQIINITINGTVVDQSALDGFARQISPALVRARNDGALRF